MKRSDEQSGRAIRRELKRRRRMKVTGAGVFVLARLLSQKRGPGKRN